jgi:hypothetical protein
MRLKTLQVGSPLYKIACEALQFGKRALTLEYKKLCELFVGVDAPVFHFHQPGPCHERYCNCFVNKCFLFNVADKKVHWLNILFLIHG